MSTQLSLGLVALLTMTTWLAPATVDAQARQRYPSGPVQSSGSAYNDGYREGRMHGERDARAGRTSDYRRDRVYQQAEGGFYGYGSRDADRNAFRQGYAEGYRTAYAQYARRSSGGYYGDYGPRYGGRGYGAAGFDRGYSDGYEEGLDAARDRDRYDPFGEKDYRKADAGYDRRYGSKDYYKNTYRDGFKSGYDRGFNDGRYTVRGPSWR